VPVQQKDGSKRCKFAKGVYVNGHEREDVVEYRKKFLEVIEG